MRGVLLRLFFRQRQMIDGRPCAVDLYQTIGGQFRLACATRRLPPIKASARSRDLRIHCAFFQPLQGLPVRAAMVIAKRDLGVLQGGLRFARPKLPRLSNRSAGRRSQVDKRVVVAPCASARRDSQRAIDDRFGGLSGSAVFSSVDVLAPNNLPSMIGAACNEKSAF